MANPLLREPLAPEHIKPRLLGHWGTTPGPEHPLHAPEPVHRARRARHDVRDRSRPRRSRDPRELLARRHVLRGVPRHPARRAGDGPVVPAVLVPRWRAQSRGAGDPGLDPRRRRARLLADARVRRRVRQPRPRRRVRRRRRRGRDRSARDELALEQVPRSRARRRGAADPAPQRVQDRQPHRARAHQRRRAHTVLRRARVDAATSSRATTPRSSTSSWPRRSTTRSARSGDCNARRATRATGPAPAGR